MLANGKWLTALSMALALGACSSNGDGGAAQGDAVVVAQVNDRAITLAEIDEQIAGELYEARSEALQARVTELIIELEAEQRGVSPDELIALEAAELGAISDEEVEAFFQQNRARMRPNETLENVGPEIRRFLADHPGSLADAAFLRHLEPDIDPSASGQSTASWLREVLRLLEAP